MLNCPVCGAAVGLSWRACAECGHKLEPALPSPAAAPEAAPPPEPELPPGAKPCLNHPNREAVAACSICAEPFCAECVDQPGPGAICASCAAAEGRHRGSTAGEPVVTAMTKQAREALILSIVGFFCCGIILQPMALVKAIKVRNQAKISPVPIKGTDEATIAMIISIVGLGFWVLVIFTNIALKSIK